MATRFVSGQPTERAITLSTLGSLRRVLCRAECLFSLIAIRHARTAGDHDEGRHGQAMVGRDKLMRIHVERAFALDDYAALDGKLLGARSLPSGQRRGRELLRDVKERGTIGVYAAKAAAYAAIARYIHGFFNPARLHSALRYVSPDDYAKKMKRAG